MDFKNMLQKNVGNMKSKLPPMPNMPKLPKLKSRKIFNLNRSKENVSNDGDFSTSQLSIGQSKSQLQIPLPPPSAIVNRSPHRISTISSLVEGGQQIEYNISDRGDGGGRNRRHIHFEDSNNDEKSTSTRRFTERLTKQYKELSEFKFSHIFGKKTIVRTTEIQVDMYKQSFDHENNELAAERRMSTDYEFEFRSIPATGNSSADEPHTPAAPSVSSASFGPSSSNIQISNIDDIKNYAGSTSPPLSRRKTFNQQNDNDESTIPANKSSSNQQKQNWKIKSFKKKSFESSNDDVAGGVTKGSIKSKSGSGMWQLKRPTRRPASQDSIDENQEVATENFKKSLNNIFKKLPSLTSFDEPSSDSNTKSPKKPGMWKLQRPARIKVSTENIPSESNGSKDSEFVKQFNKIVGKSSKIKTSVQELSTTTENVTTQPTETEDPSKVKSLEEIKSLGYGKKNLKYISMWKVRRRREIRRNEPFPLNRDDSLEDESLKTPGMWQLRRPTRIKTVINEGDPIDNTGNPQLADLTKSLMNLFKRNQNSVGTGTEDGQTQEQHKRNSIWKKQKIVPTSATTTDEYVDTCMDGNSLKENSQSGSSVQSKMWKFRQAIGQESFDADVHIGNETENKPGFWKKMSHKKKDSKKENNDENVVDKPNMMDKAKKQITLRMNLQQGRSVESEEPQQESIKTTDGVVSIDFKNKLQHSMDSFESCNDSDPETLADFERINRNITWGRQNILSHAYATDSDEEDVITTPGFLQNQPISSQHNELEPTIIIVSKPVPTILHYESVIQQQRLYPLLPIEPSITTPPTSPPPPPPPIPNSFQFLELPRTVGLPTPPPPKRQMTPPLSAQQDNILTPPQSPVLSSKSPSPPLLPTSLPPELSPPKKSLPPPLPTSPRPQLKTLIETSPILQPSRPQLDNKTRYKHSRKPSMDSNDSESWIPDNLRNRNNILELNKIEETFEQFNSVNKSTNGGDDSLKKWKSIDIFNGSDEIFDDFDDELKNEPIITIAENISQKQSILIQMKNLSEQSQPTGVPVILEKHKITRPLVKQGSLRRQFSEEKDAEDLNKKRNVNKMISRFDPERGSSRRSIKYDRNQHNTTTLKDSEEKTVIKEATVVGTGEKHKNLIGNLKKTSSLDVEIDKNEVQSMNSSTTEDDSDNSDFVVQHIPVRPPTVLERIPGRQPTVLEKKPIPDNKNAIIQNVPEKPVLIIERKLAPKPPTTIKITASATKTLDSNQNEDRRKIMDMVRQIDNREIMKDSTIIKSVKDSNENNRNLNMKRNILHSRQHSEDNFYSLDYTEEDETIKIYPADGMSLVKEEYSIEL